LDMYDPSLERRLNERQPPGRVMDSLGIRPGMTVAEVGVGRGRYGVHVARRLGSSGRFIGVDIHRGRLSVFEERCRREGLGNVETVLSEDRNPRLPPGEVDLVYIISTYHHVEDPVGLLRGITPCLRPGGRLAIIEKVPRKAGRSDFVDTLANRARYESISQEGMLEDAKKAGYQLVETFTYLPVDDIYVFERAP
jgi:ubiquinone/menaquinone biosynthesis C-methylase UbiE